MDFFWVWDMQNWKIKTRIFVTYICAVGGRAAIYHSCRWVTVYTAQKISPNVHCGPKPLCTSKYQIRPLSVIFCAARFQSCITGGLALVISTAWLWSLRSADPLTFARDIFSALPPSARRRSRAPTNAFLVSSLWHLRKTLFRIRESTDKQMTSIYRGYSQRLHAFERETRSVFLVVFPQTNTTETIAFMPQLFVSL